MIVPPGGGAWCVGRGQGCCALAWARSLLCLALFPLLAALTALATSRRCCSSSHVQWRPLVALLPSVLLVSLPAEPSLLPGSASVGNFPGYHDSRLCVNCFFSISPPVSELRARVTLPESGTPDWTSERKLGATRGPGSKRRGSWNPSWATTRRDTSVCLHL